MNDSWLTLTQAAHQLKQSLVTTTCQSTNVIQIINKHIDPYFDEINLIYMVTQYLSPIKKTFTLPFNCSLTQEGIDKTVSIFLDAIKDLQYTAIYNIRVSAEVNNHEVYKNNVHIRTESQINVYFDYFLI
jgi:hypothetical protein